MRASLLLVAVAACADQPDRAPAPLAVHPPVAHAQPVVKPPPPPPKPAITSIHGLPIRMLAVTEDGTSAVTSDQKGNLRVWPALDGTREPVVVHGPVPIDLAIGRRNEELSIAIVDQAGSLTIVRLDREGRTLGHTQLADEQPVVELQATTQGFLAVTADQAIELVEYSGVRWGGLPAKERIAALVYRNGRALVLHESTPKHIKGRWIELLDGARWGDETAELELDAKHTALHHAVLSPDHTRLAVEGAGERLLAFELSTAVVTSLAPSCEPLGYLDDDIIACVGNSDIAYVDRKGKRAGTTATQTPEAITVAGHQLAFGHMEAIALADAKSTRYLGYSVATVRTVRESGIGTVFAGNQRFVADPKLGLDKLLHPITATYEETAIIDAMPLSPKLDAALWRLDEYSNYLQIGGKTVLDPIKDTVIHYEPTTGLIAEVADGATLFVQTANDKVGPRLELATSTSPLSQYFVDTSEANDTVYLTDPALADGRVAMVVHGSRVNELRDLAKKIRPAKIYAVDGVIKTIDRAGHIFKRKRSKTDVLLHGTAVAFADTATATAITPSPDGKLVAFASPTSIALFAIDGTLRWRVASTDRTLSWTRDGRLLAVSGGTETLDLATGAPIGLRCGWGFGISQTPLDDSPQGDLVCDR